MTLKDQVKNIIDSLSSHGWRDLLLKITNGELDIQQHTSDLLQKELLKELTHINRDFPGFEDFAVDATKAITPGNPARSLLLHALASPLVTSSGSGKLTLFPTLKQLDTIENFVFGVEPPTVAELIAKAQLQAGEKLQIVVFAFEYRCAADSCSKIQADYAFSRTGISRIGTADFLYDLEARGFQSDVDSNPFAFRVCPARFGAFLAVQRKGDPKQHLPMRFVSDDQKLKFWIPVHKLFSGDECLAGQVLDLKFESFVYNDKIRRVHVSLGNNGAPQTYPYQFSAGIAALSSNLLSDEITLPPGVLIPVVHQRLVETALDAAGKRVTFKLKKGQHNFACYSPGTSTMDGAEVRPAPAYVHARTRIENGLEHDLTTDEKNPDVAARVNDGDYDAQNYVDFTGDGFVTITNPGFHNVENQIDEEILPAYTIVAAPDFFPTAGQRELFEWISSPAVQPDLAQDIWLNDDKGGVPPIPLCDTRLPANIMVPNNKFNPAEKTVTAIVPMVGSEPKSKVKVITKDAQRHSTLPDDAAGFYAPGWDISTDFNNNVHHLAAYGLGSPFPEDSKLCAALSTFWPAVAPDVTRSMSNAGGNEQLRHTLAPLTDEETGQIGELPWDGNPGPKLTVVNGLEMVEYASFHHVDYVKSALENRFTARLTSKVNAEEYKRRVIAMALVYKALGTNKNEWCVFSFKQVLPGDSELHRAQMDATVVLPGKFVYRLDLFKRAQELPGSDFMHIQMPMLSRNFFFVDPDNSIVLRRSKNQSIWAAAPI